MKWAADVICNNGSIAASTASVAFAWSVLRWRDVFGDVAMDILRRHASSQRWSVLGNRLEWDLSTDLRVRWLLQSGSRLCLGVGVGLGVYSIIVRQRHITWFFEKGDGLTEFNLIALSVRRSGSAAQATS